MKTTILALLTVLLAACGVPPEYGDLRGPITPADRVAAAKEAEAYCAELGKKAKAAGERDLGLLFDCVD